jgi:tripartite-type tricarboxylate transporter receptor subunit TctC
MFQRAAGVELVHVPYKGSAAYMPDILSGKVQMVFDNISNALHQIEARKLRALAVTGARRSAALQDVPTMVELGFLGFEVLSWQAVFAPAGVPKDIIDRLNKAIVAAVHDDHVRAQLSRQGIEPTGSSSAELAAYLQVEKNRWGRIIREEGIKLEQ